MERIMALNTYQSAFIIYLIAFNIAKVKFES